MKILNFISNTFTTLGFVFAISTILLGFSYYTIVVQQDKLIILPFITLGLFLLSFLIDNNMVMEYIEKWIDKVIEYKNKHYRIVRIYLGKKCDLGETDIAGLVVKQLKK